ncbi:hypothetical protein [Sphingobacterium sp. SYP-B4668]|uniref:hypothetical protein n=1 Tax=Sphingobacterium sp. SYP-B4668 TaxID=2996035 RepID=UPI0022DD9D18|nr:hypothetical protein [Sphingobacterium sp. SYP-B4668]
MKHLIVLFVSCVVLHTGAAQQSKPQSFINAFERHLGQYYEGKIIAGGKEGDGFTGKPLLMQVLSWDAGQVKVPFYVGDDKSRTWIFSLVDERIELKHDHRMSDGTPDKITFYGGVAPNEGTASLQMFPADVETCALIDYACFNVWWVTLEQDKFTYNLRRIGSDRLFSVEFDLTKPIQSDFKPW